MRSLPQSVQPYEDPEPMSSDDLGHLTRQLLRVRAIVAAEVPSSPAWAATVEWREELEAEIRSMGIDPDDLDRSCGPGVRSRTIPTPPDRSSNDRLAASGR
jgi:hypothetical protein